MDEISQIRMIRSQILDVMKEITCSPKPSYILDGLSVSWAEYLERLQKTLNWCDEKILHLEPFVNHSIGTT